jgi:hypothetical protein
MHFIQSALGFISQVDHLAIPFGQMLLFIIINSLCLLLGRYKLGLLISYCFVLFWGYISNRPYFIDTFGQTSWGLVVYALAGIAMVVIFIFGFFQSDKE